MQIIYNKKGWGKLGRRKKRQSGLAIETYYLLPNAYSPTRRTKGGRALRTYRVFYPLGMLRLSFEKADEKRSRANTAGFERVMCRGNRVLIVEKKRRNAAGKRAGAPACDISKDQ